MRAKLCTSATLPSASEARSASVGVVALRPRSAAFGLADDQRGQRGEHDAQHDQQQRQPPVQEQRQRQQHEQRHEGGEMLAEERQPQPPQRIGAGEHHLHQPAGMRAAVEATAAAAARARNSRSVTACRRRCDSRSACSATSTPQTMVNSPKPTQAASSGVRSVQVGRRAAACAPASASMMRPNSTGSANCAAASARLATASSQPRRASGPAGQHAGVESDEVHGRDQVAVPV